MHTHACMCVCAHAHGERERVRERGRKREREKERAVHDDILGSARRALDPSFKTSSLFSISVTSLGVNTSCVVAAQSMALSVIAQQTASPLTFAAPLECVTQKIDGV